MHSHHPPPAEPAIRDPLFKLSLTQFVMPGPWHEDATLDGAICRAAAETLGRRLLADHPLLAQALERALPPAQVRRAQIPCRFDHAVCQVEVVVPTLRIRTTFYLGAQAVASAVQEGTLGTTRSA